MSQPQKKIPETPVSDGVDYNWSCEKHAPAARAAADLRFTYSIPKGWHPDLAGTLGTDQ